MSFSSHYCRRSCLLAAAVVAVGCRQSEKIQSYTVPKEPPRSPVVSAGEVAAATGNESATTSAPSAPTDRMLAAILPDGGRAWFFKVVGPVANVGKHADQIAEFFTTIRPAGDQPLPTWKLPAGWTQEPGNEMRAATIVIPGDKRLELSVTSLGWQGQREDLLNNINRWRGQMRLPSIGPQQLANTTREIKVDDATMTVVDLLGRFQSGGMMAPFAGGSPPSNAPPNDLPAGHPPIGPSAPAVAAQPGVPKFEAPPSWQSAPGSEFSRATFTLADGSRTARVTISDFPANAGLMIADPLANMNRWRRELGLAEVDKDSLDKVSEPMLVDGLAAIYMPAIPEASKPEESQVSEATLAAMVPQGNRVWFFKLKGDRELVIAEQQHFKDFLKSVRFPADRGVPDGN